MPAARTPGSARTRGLVVFGWVVAIALGGDIDSVAGRPEERAEPGSVRHFAGSGSGFSGAGPPERIKQRIELADGRSSFAVLTPAGRNALRRAWPGYREAIRRRLGAHLTAPQCRQLASLLEQATAGAEAAISGKAGR